MQQRSFWIREKIQKYPKCPALHDTCPLHCLYCPHPVCVVTVCSFIQLHNNPFFIPPPAPKHTRTQTHTHTHTHPLHIHKHTHTHTHTRSHTHACKFTDRHTQAHILTYTHTHTNTHTHTHTHRQVYTESAGYICTLGASESFFVMMKSQSSTFLPHRFLHLILL